MIIKEIYSKIKDSDKYNDFKEENPEHYLSHIFKMFEKNGGDIWQIGFYEVKEDKIVTFVYNETSGIINREPESEVFKKNDTVKKLVLDNVNIDYKEILVKVDSVQKEKYKGQEPIKIIMILQNFDGEDIYNITYVTRAFKTLNIRIDAKSGDLVSDKIVSIFDFKGKDGD